MTRTLQILLMDPSRGYTPIVTEILNRKNLFVQIKQVKTSAAFETSLRTDHWDAIFVTYPASREIIKLLAATALQKIPLLILCEVDEEEEAFELTDKEISDVIPVTHFGRLPHILRREIELTALQLQTDSSFKDLEDNENHTMRLFMDSLVPVWVYDPQSLQLLAANEAAIKKYGYSKDEFLDMTIANLFLAEDLSRFLDFIHQSADNFKRAGSWKHLLKDGRLIEVEISYETINFGGKPLVAVLAYDITERKYFEETLKRSEARFRSVIEGFKDVILIADIYQLVRYTNAALTRVLGFTTSDVLGRPFSYLLDPAEEAKTSEDLAALLQVPGSIQTSEHRMRRSDGGWEIIEMTGQSLPDPTGQAMIILHFRSITIQKEAERGLRQSEERYRHIVEDQTELICRYNPDFRITFANRAYSALYGKPPEEILGVNFLDRIPVEDQERAINHVKALTASNHVATSEHQSFLPDGTVRWFQWTDRALVDENGNIVEYQGVGRDITDQKNHLIEQQEHTRAMEEIQHFLQATLNAFPANTAVLERDGTIISVNKGWEIFGTENGGLSGGQYLGTNYLAACEKATGAGSAEARPAAAGIRAVIKGQQDSFYLEYPCNTGVDPLWFGMQVTAFAEPAPRRVVVAHINITERKKSQEKLHKIQEQFLQSQKMEAIGRLAGGVAHDFNNLLVAIVGYSDLLIDAFPSSDPRANFISEIEKAGERATALTRQLLAFSRRQPLKLKSVELNQVIISFEKMVQRLIGEDILLELNLDSALGLVLADESQLEQIILNLAVNARDAMPKGGKITICTKNIILDEKNTLGGIVVKEGPHIMLTVSDTGTGMSDDVKSHIFEPFFTTKEQGKGTGLGLSTVYGIVEQFNGYITVESNPGKGTTFNVFLPMATSLEVQPTNQTTRPEKAQGKELILIVEDEALVRGLIREVLSKSGYEVLVAQNGAEAVALGNAHPDIQLVVTDMVMPDMNGIEVAEHLLTLKPELKVLFMSGYPDRQVLQQELKETNIQFLQKPFSPLLLLQKIEEVLK